MYEYIQYIWKAPKSQKRKLSGNVAFNKLLSYFGPCREHGLKSKAKVIVKCQRLGLEVPQPKGLKVELLHSSQTTPRGNVSWTHTAAPKIKLERKKKGEENPACQSS